MDPTVWLSATGFNASTLAYLIVGTLVALLMLLVAKAAMAMFDAMVLRRMEPFELVRYVVRGAVALVICILVVAF